jgi:cell division protein FtsN
MPEPIATEITSADTTAGDSTSTLYRAAIGSVSTDYYLPIFTHFESTDRVGMRWNWAASLYTLNWFAYRRLWGAALVYTGAVVTIALMIFGIGRLVLQFSHTTELALLLTFALAAFVVPGLFGNAIFYAECRKKMEHALSVSATLDEACSMLKRRAGSRARLAGLALANTAVVAAIVSGYFFSPKSDGLPIGQETPTQTRNAVSGPALDAAPAPAPAPVTAMPVPAQAAPDLAATASSPTSTPTTPPPTPQAIEAAVSKVPNADAVVDADAPAKPNVELPAKPPAKTAAKAPAKAAATVPVKAPAKPNTKAAEKKQVVAPTKADKAPAQDAPYFINVGLFADDNNARNARVKLTDAGFAAFTLELKTSKGVMTRVRVGPFGSETAAESAQTKIRAMGLEALIIQP